MPGAAESRTCGRRLFYGPLPVGSLQRSTSDSYHVLGDRMVLIGDEANAATWIVALCSEQSREYASRRDVGASGTT
jgi:hypothetical protein